MLSEYHVTGEDPHLGMDKDSGGDQNDGDSEDDYTPDEIDTMIQNVDTFNEVEQCNKEVVLIAVTNIMSSKNKSVSCSVTTVIYTWKPGSLTCQSSDSQPYPSVSQPYHSHEYLSVLYFWVLWSTIPRHVY